MSRGYTLRLRDLNNRADPRKLGVRLGRACIAGDVPVSVVAAAMGVSRATVYNWFSGASVPHSSVVSRVESYLNSIS